MASEVAELSNVELALQLRDEEWWPAGICHPSHTGADESFIEMVVEGELERIAWAASIWLQENNWTPHDGMRGWVKGPDVYDTDPIRATLTAALRARDWKGSA